MQGGEVVTTDTSIGWCNHTLNLWWGCSEVHTGCANCYAKAWDRINGKGSWALNPFVWVIEFNRVEVPL